MPTTARFKKGKVTVFLIQGDYQGKPTVSYSFQKSIFKKDSKTWEKSEFYTITDLQDLQSILQRVTAQYVKYEEVKPKVQEETFDENPF